MRLFILSLLALLLLSCSNDSIDNEPLIKNDTIPYPSTEVWLNNTRLSSFDEPMVGVSDKAYYYIRIDNRVQELGNFNSNNYYPKTINGSTIFSSLNEGTTNSQYNWSSNKLYSYYTYSSKGIDNNALSSVPSLLNILKADRSNDIKNINTDELKVIWYIAKYQDNVFHVDGVLTHKDTIDVTPIIPNKEKDNCEDKDTMPSTIGKSEIDIHQQVHKDWNEIKTSIHIRDSIDKVTIVLPIDSSLVCEKDDFNVRRYITTVDGSEVKVTIYHNETNITYEIELDPSVVMKNMKETGDGITVEIHSYTKEKEEDRYMVFALLKQVKVQSNVLFNTKITSGYSY